MFYDLNVPWRIDDQETHKTVAFLRELGYNVVALSYLLSGKLPADLVRRLVCQSIVLALADTIASPPRFQTQVPI